MTTKTTDVEMASDNRKEENFRRLAERRTNAVLERLRILGNLSNRSAYAYSDEDVRKIFRAIEREMRLKRAKFRSADHRRFRLG